MENWKPIEGFDGYMVSDLGHVRNDHFDRDLTIQTNQYQNRYVSMYKEGVQFRRSVPLLVANAFVPRPQPAFKSLIHRDTHKINNRADNLMWRPQWFAVKYWNQARKGRIGNHVPVIEKKTRELYPNTWETCLAFGLLEVDLILSIVNRTFTWPTFQEFEYYIE